MSEETGLRRAVEDLLETERRLSLLLEAAERVRKPLRLALRGAWECLSCGAHERDGHSEGCWVAALEQAIKEARGEV